MFEFDPEAVHPEMVARSKEMLLDIDIAKVQAVGPAAVTFYVWVRIRHVQGVSKSSFYQIIRKSLNRIKACQ